MENYPSGDGLRNLEASMDEKRRVWMDGTNPRVDGRRKSKCGRIKSNPGVGEARSIQVGEVKFYPSMDEVRTIRVWMK